jgi:hypothetical protein
MLEILREGVEEEGLTNVEPVLGETADPRLPEESVDWMLMVDVYHELGEPETMLEHMREALKADGRVALVEYRVEDGTGDHILAAHRMSARQVMSEWESAGFHLVELHEFLPGQHLFVFAETPAGVDAEGAIEHHDLLDAMASGLVGATVRGEGATAVRMTVQRAAPGRLLITFPVGTYFPAPDGRTDMVALRDGMVLLTGEASRSWSVPARRASPGEAVPTASESLDIESADGHRRERNVMWVYQGLDFPPALAPLLEQLSLWIASADAGYDDLAALVAGAPIPPHNAVALAVAYVDSAGIDVRTTRVWSERERFVSQLTDPSLRALFDNWGMP